MECLILLSLDMWTEVQGDVGDWQRTEDGNWRITIIIPNNKNS